MLPGARTSFLPLAAFVAGLLLLIVSAVWFFLDRLAAEKIATALILPTGALWVLMVTVVVHLMRNRQRAAGRWVLLITVGYSVCGSGHVAGWLVGALEAPYVTINPMESDRQFDAIVLLGGGGGTGVNGRLQANASGDRMILAAQLYHRGATKEIICTGQRIESLSPDAADPADISREVLLALGVPDECITLLGGRNTTEEMEQLRQRFETQPGTTGLVTSAWHMQRAMRLAERVGFHPEPLPADFRSHARGPSATPIAAVIESIIPNPGAMLTSWAACKEFLGMAISR